MNSRACRWLSSIFKLAVLIRALCAYQVIAAGPSAPARDPALKEWKRLLFYHPTLTGRERGIIDSPGFYLHPGGKTDPAAEMAATIAGFKNAGAMSADTKQPLICAFPRRRDYLLRHGLIHAAELPQVACDDLDLWLSHRQYQSAWLVFSSWYPQNPASLFGHTFLRFRRSDRESDLLDDAVNFAATPTTQNPFLYGVMGLAGGFPGQFSMLPFHVKIQEYNNIESRDLWEYELNMSEDQMRRVLLSLWEFGPHSADYYYLDENCSLVLLKLLETGDITWDFSGKLKPWVVPVDTVRAVDAQPGMIRARKNRISQERLFRAREKLLDTAGRERFLAWTETDPKSRPADAIARIGQLASPEPASTSAPDSARTIDAAIEWLDFKDPPQPGASAERHEVRRALLASRREIKIASERVNSLDLELDPATAHPSTHFQSGYFASSSGEHGLEVVWTPALHDLMGPARGTAEGLEIVMVEVQARADARDRRAALTGLTLFRVRSLTPWDPAVRATSWFVDLNWNSTSQCPGRSFAGCRELSLRAGTGYSIKPGENRFVISGFLGGATGHATDHATGPGVDGSPFVEAGPLLVATYPGEQFRMHLQASAQRRVLNTGVPQDRLQATGGAAFDLAKNWDARLGVEWSKAGDSQARTLTATAGHYF
jgi:hypothetical protein